MYVSASEDTTVKCFVADSVSNTVNVFATLTSHLSSIKCIEFAAVGEENSHIMITTGGRAQMIIWKLDFDEGNSL